MRQVLKDVDKNNDEANCLDGAGHIRERVQVLMAFYTSHSQSGDAQNRRPVSNGPLVFRTIVADQLDGKLPR